MTAVPTVAAELQPPLQALRHPNYTLIAAEWLGRPVTDGRLTLRVIERLRGDPNVPDEVDILVQVGDEALIEVGARYLVFYSDVERVSFKPRTEVRRPDRRKLLHIDGAGPAVFNDTAAMRALLNPILAYPEESPHYREVVVQGLRSDDPSLVDLWSAEWALRPATFPEVSPDEVELLRGIVEDPDQRPSARARLLVAGAERTPPGIESWFANSAGSVLASTNPPQLFENTGLSQLIYASLRVARDYPGASNAQTLEKWLRAAPPLAENAALALRALNPDLERPAVVSAIDDANTPAPTREFLADHLRRLDLAIKRMN